MEPEQIRNQIANAGAWLPSTTVRQALRHRESVTPMLLEAVERRMAAGNGNDIITQRLATFGVFYLAQYQDQRIFEPLIRLIDTVDPQNEDEWLLSLRLHFFGHRLLAMVCPDAERLLKMAIDPTLKPTTRALAIPAIGLLAAYGETTRAEAIRWLRKLFDPVKRQNQDLTDTNWALTAAKLHSKKFERELQWFVGSGRLDAHSRAAISAAMQQHPDTNFISMIALDFMVDLSLNVFSRDVRGGEIGFVPNSQIPGLNLYADSAPNSRGN